MKLVLGEYFRLNRAVERYVLKDIVKEGTFDDFDMKDYGKEMDDDERDMGKSFDNDPI